MYLLKTFDATNHQLHVTNLRAYVFCPWKVINLPTEKVATLQISNSLGDKFSQWDSQNETLIAHYGKKKTETMLNVSYFEKIMSHWEYI